MVGEHEVLIPKQQKHEDYLIVKKTETQRISLEMNECLLRR